MNGIKSITEKIIAEAEQKIEEIEIGAREQCEDIANKVQEEADRLRKNLEAIAEEKGKEREEQMLCSARLEASKQIVGAKRAVIDECFTKALGNLSNLPKDEYDAITNAMLKRVDKQSDAIIEHVGKNGGFIVKQGKVTLNYKFSAIADAIRAEIEAEVASSLWTV